MKRFLRKLEKNLVSFYCTLLFSRKEVIKFSEVALVSVQCNCLIHCIVIAQRYQPWNTANTTADICLLLKNSNKTSQIKCKVCSNFFYQSFRCAKANFRPLTRRRPHLPDVNCNLISSTTRRPPEASYILMRLGPKACPSAPVGFKPETLRFWV